MKTLLTLTLALVALVTLPHAAQSSELVRCLDEAPTIFGTPGDDVITGTSDSDVIVGLGGNDVIDGGDDGDLICGGPGNDRIQTGPDGGFSFDVASGDDGDDVIVAGSTFVFAAYESSPGPVSVDLGAGVATGQGTDTLVGVNGAVGSEFDDTLRGNSKPNCLGGMGGNDTIETLAGADCLYGAAGDDVLDGGLGVDWVSFDEAPTGVHVNLLTGSASGQGKDRLAAIENVVGSAHSDAITGNAGKNAIDGSKGNDRIAGGPGADRLDGQAGRDRVDGGTGRDRCLGAERKQRCP
jgi:Ca2+-binding RTX toxin-like protein